MAIKWGVWGRIVAILAGAGVLFGLRQAGQELYVGITAGIVVYFVLRGAFAYVEYKTAK